MSPAAACHRLRVARRLSSAFAILGPAILGPAILGPAILSPAILVVASATSSSAQSYTGGLRGAVRDAQGVVPGAEVVLVNEETNLTRATRSNDAGEYTLTNLVPGLYRLQVAMSGFARYEQASVRLATQQTLVIDVTLQPGGVTEEIKVTGAGGVLETGSASVSALIDRRALETTPTPGRNPFFLAVTTPNVVPSGDPQFVRQQDQTNASLLSLAGGPRRGNNYTLDGVPITDMRNRAVFVPSIEAIEEVKVQVSTYDAEMGRTGGGVFNTVGKSGSNTWHGSGLVQSRPEWGQGRLFFAKQQDLPKPDSYYWLYGGSFGGPILESRTFFWASTENYKTLTSRNAVLILPTQAERNGDFSQSGITVYDPLTTRPDPANPGQFLRDPFPGNVIPADRISPVTKGLLSYLPLPSSGRNLPAVASLVDRANQFTGKVDHRWTDRLTTSGLYAYYDSTEPESRFYGGDLGENPADPGEGALYRTVHVLTLNNTWVPSNATVVAFRYGYTQFQDNDVPNTFDLSSLGFSRTFVDQVAYSKFPVITVDGYGRSGSLVGDRARNDLTWYSHGANASLSRLWGRHTLKAGADYRLIGARSFARGQGSGSFGFSPAFTQGPNPNVASARHGDAFASLLLGYPSTGSITVGTPSDFFVHYAGGYVQDDVRLSSRVTVNAGLRYEYETGLSERDRQLTVGFDRTRPFPVQVPGMSLTGGLMYAGVDGYPTHQGDPSRRQLAPRAGLSWSIDERTVMHGGYGLFWAPTQYPAPGENAFGTRGFTAVTSYFASADGGLTPAGTLTNPFPTGIEQPAGSSGGLATGAGGDVHFIDQFSRPAYVQQFSVDLQRELPGRVSVSAGYVGSRSDRLSVGGTADATVNINQVPAEQLALGSALQALVPNPFYGNAAFGALGRSPTIARGQLLRPYPQFLGVFAHRVSEARARYHSLVLKADKRLADGWGLRVNYTFSRLDDNQFGETNFFANRGALLDNSDLEREYGRSLLDTPHRLNIIGTYELPIGDGKRWSPRGLLGVVASGWAITGVGTYQSGFPLQVFQNNNNAGLLGSGQRPNLVPGVDPATSGSSADRVGAWLNPAAWSAAAPFTFGDAPRTDARVRTPFKTNWDIAIQKTQRLRGGAQLMLRAEIINAFDQPNFRGPQTAFGLASFGQVTEVGGFPRLLQLMARLSF